MERDERLESISDRIRRGEPVGFFEAIEAIDYQQSIRKERDIAKDNIWWRRAMKWLTHPTT